MNSEILIIDYGVGNIGSVVNMLRKIGVNARLSGNADEIDAAQKLILPGVGSFDHGMEHLTRSGLRAVLDKKALHDATPILGICLGMQLLCEGSEEGTEAGLGWIKGRCTRFNMARMQAEKPQKYCIPHMGWNIVTPTDYSDLYNGLEAEARFYFVHSYHMDCANEGDILARAHYGYPVTASVRRGNIYGTQFHPEKSHAFGMTLLKNFAEL